MFLSCATCREVNSEALRLAMGCGWLHLEYDEDDDGTALPPPSVWKHPQDTDHPMICPGYTTSLPEVIDIASAYPAHEKGNLAAYFPDGVSRALMDGFSELDRSISMFIAKPAKGNT